MSQSNALESLGERMVKAARLAVAMHLQQATAGLNRQVVIGGTGPYLLDEVVRGEAVTDDRFAANEI